MSSSPKRPPSPSLASTAAESTGVLSSGEKRDSALPQPLDEKLDPWLVSFGPDDPDYPLVRGAFPLVSHPPPFLTA
jgi:hypothetical protein